jgi:predicted nucleic acid-binding protein
VNVLIDTCIWSETLRRHAPLPAIAGEVRRLMAENRVAIIGPVRQELLSGIVHEEQFKALKAKLRAFTDIPLTTPHYELAAEYSNACRAKGVIGSHVDFLICAAAKLEKLAIFTTDVDFSHYSKVIGLALYKLPKEA